MPLRATPSRSSLTLGFKSAGRPARIWPSSNATAPFTTSTSLQKTTRQRSEMYKWMKLEGERYATPQGVGPNYLGAFDNQPFPLNALFRSQSVLDERMREIIYNRVKEGQSLKAISADFGVDLRRVGAVVRLKEIEKQWVAQGKPLARPYQKAVLSMLPKTAYTTQHKITHEPINDIHVHKLTMQQLFVPVSESRQFNREDAAKAFHRKMLSADARSPHPELIEMQKDVLQGTPADESLTTFREKTKAAEAVQREKALKRSQKDEALTTRVYTGRFEFRFKEISVDEIGGSGRGRRGVGWRYGVPHYDRKKGQVKIPTSAS